MLESNRCNGKNKDAKALVLTYPTYYGTCFDLEKVIKEAKRETFMFL
ncbi:hypothetical protein PL321_06115 [Caloramator sp. mosi_1]|nr:hypothetical protein [Caloramator sp. mosi_1]WDC85085.1 hypothetical protein PL321_06115 [Caloramator sp. mosi_1]